MNLNIALDRISLIVSRIFRFSKLLTVDQHEHNRKSDLKARLFKKKILNEYLNWRHNAFVFKSVHAWLCK